MSDLMSTLRQAGMVLAAAMALIVALGVGLQADLRLKRWYVPLVAGLLIAVPAIGVVLQQRDVTQAIDFAVQAGPPPVMVWFLRLSSVALVGLSLVRITSRVMSRERAEPGPGVLMVAFFAYFICNYLLNAVFGSVPAPPIVPSIYAALVLGAVYMSRDADPVLVQRFGKLALMAVMAGSLAPLAFDPGMVRQVETAEIRIAGVGFRLFGLGSNPNNIATLALVNLLLALHQPFRNRLLEAANVSITLGVLVLAQSQTSWLAALIGVPVLLLGRSGLKLLDKRMLVALCVLLMLATVGIMGLALFTAHGLTLSDFVTGDRYREITSLTGRSAIWRAALLEWEDNPLFGYGPTMWDSGYRGRIGLPFAFTAHNQYLQSLAVAGAVGLCSTLAYLAALGWHCFTAPRAVRGLALALYSQMLMRSITEVPLDIGTPFANEFFPQFLLFFILVTAHEAAGARSIGAAAGMADGADALRPDLRTSAAARG
ncbi:MAG: O-antigen ligase family protein [Burkholderiaceae bacterium]|nr:O-antigen ligase family protein [Burkholderiaceae bacterium]